MNEELIKKIISIIKEKVDIDFDNYKINTILRRLRQRTTILGFVSLEDYYKYLIKNLDKEAKILSEYFLINTTEFFRDPMYFYYFNYLVKKMIRSNTMFIKILSIGCSSGEEPYSIAMILNERKSKCPELEYQIDAIDIDSEAIMEAKKAVYWEDAVKNVPYNYLKKYFHQTENKYKLIHSYFDKNISFYVRDIFKLKSLVQGLLQYNFIFARNIFFYFKENKNIELFDRIIKMLDKGGYLILGSSEQLLKEHAPLFKQVCPGIKIFEILE